jgi:site-specific recombinase XerD
MTRNLDHHLQLHGRQWRVRLEIPIALRPQFGGQRFLTEAFAANSRTDARLLRDKILTGFKLRITQARNPDDPVLQRARMIRDDLLHGDDATAERAFIEAAKIADGIEAAKGKEAGDNIFHIATGTVIPLREYLEEWLADKGFTGKTALQHRKAFTVLYDWLKATNTNTTINAVTRRTAWRYIEAHLKVTIRATKTLNRYLSAYRTHWDWLMQRAHIEANPWAKTHRPEGRRRGDDDEGETRKRAFTDTQITTLLKGDAPDPLPDLMMIGALSGARIDAIASLRVRDCKNGAFTFKRQKKEPRDRTIPIHSQLTGIVARRVKGKGPDEFLFHEMPIATSTRPRSAAASQAFTRYRRKTKIGADPGEQSPYDFHSFRRWFTTKAEQAGQPPHIIDFVTGHKRPGETLGRYSEGPSMAQMKKCVEAVKLPH